MIKKVAQTIALILILPVYLVYQIFALIHKDESFATCSQFMSLFPGKVGNYLRNSFYAITMTNCEQEVAIAFGTLFSQIDTEIASGTYIGPHCNIGRCSIGKDCLLGSGVHILSGKNQHNFADPTTPIRHQGGKLTKISIGQNTWIGNCAVVLADVGEGCVIAAGAVVVHPVADNTIVAGNPARVIKQRIPASQSNLKQGSSHF